MTKDQLWTAIGQFRRAKGAEEQHATHDALDVLIDRVFTERDAAPIPPVREPLSDAVIDELTDIATIAMDHSWRLGQTYWQQADSEYQSQWKKSDATQAKFQERKDAIRGAIEAAIKEQK